LGLLLMNTRKLGFSPLKGSLMPLNPMKLRNSSKVS
jgi:hypothetical protein